VNFTWLEEANLIPAPFSRGHCINEIAGDRYPRRYRGYVGEVNWMRPRALREE